MKLLKLVESRVKAGVALPWSVRNSNGLLLLARGHVIQDDEQARHLVERGAYVDAEEARSVLTTTDGKANATAPRSPDLFSSWTALYQRLEAPLRSIDKSPEFPHQIGTLASDTVAMVERDADICIYMIVRQENVQFFNYGFTHSVHSAMAGLLMARRLGWSSSDRLALVSAALTMNVSIVGMQGRVAAQDGPLLASQKVAIQEHTVASCDMLRAAGITDHDWLTAVAQHHEFPDGSGYPAGLTEIAPMALLLRHADTFTAKISPRASRPGITTQEAARELFQEDKGGAMSTALIREFGIHPPGEFVRLKSGELAVVTRRSASVSSPLAASVTDTKGAPTSNTVQRDTGDPRFAIVAPVTDAKANAMMARIPPQRLYGLIR